MLALSSGQKSYFHAKGYVVGSSPALAAINGEIAQLVRATKISLLFYSLRVNTYIIRNGRKNLNWYPTSGGIEKC